MEGGLQMSPQLGYPVDSSDAKYVSGLSTILVATIQEAKDRISQIEYIFCSQLFPNFQSKSKIIQKLYSEAMKAAEDAWKEKEKDFSLQIEKLQFEKQQSLEENRSLKLEKAKLEKIEGPSSICSDELQEELKQKTEEVKELEEKNKLLVKNMRCLEVEADGAMEQKAKLLQLLQSKVSLIGHREKQLKEQEEKTAEISSKLESMKAKVDELQWQLGEKTKQVDGGKELQECLLKKIELQASEMAKNKQPLIDYENEKRLLQKKLGERVEEVEERRKMLEQELEELQKEKRLLMGKIKVLEENAYKLQLDLRERSYESTEGMELHGKLLQQIESKDAELLFEKKKRRDVIVKGKYQNYYE